MNAMENWTKGRGGPDQSHRETDIVVKNVTMQFKRVKDEATSIKELLVRKLRGAVSYTHLTLPTILLV